MTFIFYFLFLIIGLIVELYRLSKIKTPSVTIEKCKVWYKLKEQDRDDDKKPDPGEIFAYLCNYFFELFYTILTFIGLFSTQWVCFLLLVIIGFIFFTEKIRKIKVVILVDSILSIIIILFIVLNKYHLHINVYHHILNLF